MAQRGHDVAIVERQRFPRPKTCGDALSPRAVRQLHDLGLGPVLAQLHRTDGLRLVAHGRRVEVPWPTRRDLPSYGLVARRHQLDAAVAARASAAGATLLEGCDAVAPVVERGFVRGAVVQPGEGGAPFELAARYVLVADGANSRFGRAIGTVRTRDWPYATAIRSYWASPRHDEHWIESTLGVTDRTGTALPGYGWVVPVGDGTVNVGVGLLSTFRDAKAVNLAHLLDEHVHRVADGWGLEPGRPSAPPSSGRVPMGGSVGPKAGPTYLVVGDAAGSANPFTGTGVECALETGRIAAEVLDEALSANDPTALQRYSAMLDAEYGQYFKVGRLFARVVSRPAVLREVTRVGIHSRSMAEWAVRITANLLRPDQLGPAEAAYRAAAALARLAPTA